MRTISLSAFLMLLFIALKVNAQQLGPLFSGHFTKLRTESFETLARTIESSAQGQSDRPVYHFYFDARTMDTITCDVTVSNLPISGLLDQLFSGTSFHYAIDGEGNIFLTKDWIIHTVLDPDFFRPADSVHRLSWAAGRNEGAPLVLGGVGAKTKLSKSNLDDNVLHEIGIRTNNLKAGNALVNGYIKNVRSGDAIAGAIISCDKPAVSASSDQYGYFSLTLPRGYHILHVQGIGMSEKNYQVMLYTDGTLDIDLKERVTTLKTVIVSASKLANINRVQLGVEHLDIKTIKQVPTVMGEADILRVVLTLPGVKTVGEASTGLNVRGGSADQNLILFNDVTVYNPSHFFGMFSAFNPDVVKDVELYKSSIPAKYGGRVSSVLDITSREGNKKEFHGVAGVGPVTSRLTLEGPLDKDKTSFILGGRMTYANWLLNLLPGEYSNSRGAFNDLDLTISHEINKKNNLYFTGYLSNDKFNLNSDTTYRYGNRNFSVKWKHVFSNKLSSVYTVGYDRYQYGISSGANPVNGFKLNFDINQLNAKADFNWYVHSKHTLDFGVGSIRYTLHPGSYEPYNGASMVVPEVIQREQALENAAYISDRYSVSTRLSIVAGIRYSLYYYLGPHTENIYAPGLPVQTTNQTGTVDYSSGKFIQTYQGPEYRLSLRYAFSNDLSIKAGYNSLRQYTHMLSNTTVMAPTDVWKLSDPHIKPQTGDQVSMGLYKNLLSNTIEVSMEVYYKRLRNYLDYRSGATLIMNPHIETDVLNSRGKAYGLEFMIKKQEGKLNGWVSYTRSRTFLRTDDPTAGETVNEGQYYPADFDIPNDFTLVGNFRVNHRFSISTNVVYYTGRPITLPIGQYMYAGSERVLYSDRNQYRIPDYFRTDLSLNVDGNHKVHQWSHNSWTFGVYNLTGRKNPYSVYFISQNGLVNGYKLSIFGSAIPFVNYNIRF